MKGNFPVQFGSGGGEVALSTDHTEKHARTLKKRQHLIKDGADTLLLV